MKFLGFACLAVLLGVSSAKHAQMQINYYSENNCTHYEGHVVVSWATYLYHGNPKFNCYGYNYGTSVNIANCYEDYCVCQFYVSGDCTLGNPKFNAIAYSSGNCLQDSSSSYNSFECFFA
jgi:hypothetical protein